MRFLTLLALLWSLLSFSVCQAAPLEVTDEMGRLITDGNLLNRIGEVSSRVEARASQLVVGALGFLGVPYRRGGSDVETGFDCSGFVRAIYQQTAGLLLPRRASEQAASTEKIDKTELKPGDLVFFNTMRRAFSHVGIYVGNGKFIHAPKPGGEVRVEDLGTSYWAKRFDGARRVLFETGSPNEPQPQ
jgi:cell wall-associated NlpC family hydrolase